MLSNREWSTLDTRHADTRLALQRLRDGVCVCVMYSNQLMGVYDGMGRGLAGTEAAQNGVPSTLTNDFNRVTID